MAETKTNRAGVTTVTARLENDAFARIVITSREIRLQVGHADIGRTLGKISRAQLQALADAAQAALDHLDSDHA